jgi:hypothetical protein
MRRAILVALGTGAVIASAAALGIGVAGTSESQALGREQYDAAMAGIEAARSQSLARCEEAAVNGRELCRAQASAAEMIRVADLEAMLRRTQDSARNAQRARIEARYQVERASCATLGGLKRDRCLIAAHATRGRALLEAAAPYETRS